MSTRRPTTSWLQKTINRDYSEIVHELVMGLFKDRWLITRQTIGRKGPGIDSASATTDEGFPSSVSTGEESDNDYVSSDFSCSSSCGQEPAIKHSVEDESEGFDEDDNAYGFSSLDEPNGCVFLFRGGKTKQLVSCCDDDSLDATCRDHSVPLSDKTLTPRNSFADQTEPDAMKHVYEEEEEDLLQLNTTSEEISDLIRSEEHVQYEETISKIYTQNTKIQQLEMLLNIGARSRGYIGSIPHVQAAKNLMIAKRTRRALTESLARKYYFPSSDRLNFPKGKITVNDIQCDTNHIGKRGDLPRCYYMVAIQHGQTVLHTKIQAPNCYGMVEFKNHMVFDDVSHDFTIKMFLYKLSLTQSKVSKSRPFSRKFRATAPRMQLIGEQEITMGNIRRTAFFFDNEIVYTNLLLSINTGREGVRGGVILGKIVRKNKLQTKLVMSNRRWGVLEGTDLKIYESPIHARYSEPIDVLRMTQCKSCKPQDDLPNALVLDMVQAHSSAAIYLVADNRNKFRQWLRALNSAILVTKKWDSQIR